jgi:hypothetical protein
MMHVFMYKAFCVVEKKREEEKEKEKENNGFDYFSWVCWKLKRKRGEKHEEKIMVSNISCGLVEGRKLKRKKKKKKLTMVVVTR